MSNAAQLAAARAQDIARKYAAKIAPTQSTHIDSPTSQSVLGKRPNDSLDPSQAYPPAAPTSMKRTKVMIPDGSAMNINYIGLLLGPKGATKTRMEAESGARIVIRGRGSSRDGLNEDDSEDLHVLITADNDAALRRAEDIVNGILTSPDNAQQLKSSQLRSLTQERDTRDTNSNYPIPAPASLPSSSSSSSSSNYADPQANYNERSVNIVIPNEKVGWIIGRSGETVHAIEKSTDSRIHVAREANANGADRTITIYGATAEVIKNAENEIARILSGSRTPFGSAYGGGGGGTGSSHFGGGMNGRSELISIPVDLVGTLIGRNGEKIRTLEARSGAKIKVSKEMESDPSKPHMRDIRLEGGYAEIDAAKREINDLVRDNATGNGYHHGNDRGGDRSDHISGGATATLHVPKSSIGVVIGRNGETIKQIQKMTDTRIVVSKEDINDHREVTISGDPLQIEQARLQIDNLVQHKQLTGGLIQLQTYPTAQPPQQQQPPQAGYGYAQYPPYAQQPAYDHQYYGGGYGAAPQSAAAPVDPHAYPAYAGYGAGGSNGAAPAAAPPPAEVSLPQPPADPALFNKYWESLTAEQQNAYRAQYNAQQSAQQTQTQAPSSAATTPSHANQGAAAPAYYQQQYYDNNQYAQQQQQHAYAYDQQQPPQR